MRSYRSHLTVWTVLRFSLAISLFLQAVVACTAPSPTATSEPTATSAPTATPEPTATPHPTSPAPPTATPTETTPPPTPTPPETPSPSAEYQLAFEATWSSETHPTDFPSNPHFSGLIGAVHSPNVRLWEEGELASPGIKNMAETGGKSPLSSEIDALIGAGSACAQISGGGINPSPGQMTLTFTATLDCPVVSVVSMIAPSPDWFVGVSGLSLLEDGAWVTQKVVELYPYDAGTDSGTSYNSANLPTSSPEGIHRIETDPFLVNGTVPPLGTFTFTRLSE
ncbi:MAG: spondin domain-containing protein [Anaerolineae bacterium]|nr:spondin domain-containing protein [Anaerolineae bacterium]